MITKLLMAVTFVVAWRVSFKRARARQARVNMARFGGVR